jgi:hypothetical protein
MFDPGMMQQMMQSPLMQQMMQNPEMMRSMLQMNPGVREVRRPGPAAAAAVGGLPFGGCTGCGCCRGSTAGHVALH